MHKTKGFTLIELLVVIAIISLLVSILLPSLSKAKEAANRVVCASNQKAIGTAFQFYLHDYGVLPSWDYDYISGYSGWGGEDTWKNILINEGYIGDEKGNGPLKEWGNNLSETSLRFFMCPGSSAVEGVRLLYGDYVYNTARSTSNPTGWPHAGCSLANPEDFKTPPASLGVIADGRPINFYDAEIAIVQYDPAVSDYRYLDYRRHSEQANVLFADGHSEGFTEQEIEPEIFLID